jgi:DNA-binding transcriptional MerR regulator
MTANGEVGMPKADSKNVNNANRSSTQSSATAISVEDLNLPDKKYFKIGEVASLLSVKPHVLRYWETEFPQVRPHKSRSGQRLYRRKDVETLLAVRHLLYVQKFTIAGARLALRQTPGPKGKKTVQAPVSQPVTGPHTQLAQVEVEGVVGAEALASVLERELSEQGGRHGAQMEEVTLEALPEGWSQPETNPKAKSQPPKAKANENPANGRRGKDNKDGDGAQAKALPPGGQLDFGFMPNARSVLENAARELSVIVERLVDAERRAEKRRPSRN